MGPLLTALGISVIIGLAMVRSALAWPSGFEGRPEQLQPGGDAGFYIWHEDDGNHLSATGPGPENHFRAVIHTDGEIEDIDQVRLEDEDSYELLDGGHTLVVRFVTYAGIDNIRWRVRGGEWMHFELFKDGHPIRPLHVYLGADGHHSPGPSFRIHR
jgi:hypothetical protein